MSAWLEQTAGRGPAPSTPVPRRPWATFTLAATVAVVSCLVLLAAVMIVVAFRVLGLYYGAGPFVELSLTVGVVAGLAGLVAAVVIAVLAATHRPSAAQLAAAAQAPAAATGPAAPGRRRVVLLGVAAVIVAASILLFLMFDALSLGYGVLGKLVVLGAPAVAAAGVIAAAIVVAVALSAGAGHLAAHACLRGDRDGRAHPVVLPRRSGRVGLLPELGGRRFALYEPGVVPGAGAERGDSVGSPSLPTSRPPSGPC